MKVVVPDYYDAFACLCSQCPRTCCAGWDVMVDEESREKYRSMEGALGEKARACMTQEDGEWSFALQAGRCPFLREDGLCEMQAEKGEAALCRTCRQFPRIIAEYGSVREIGLSLSCPEAARLILTHEGTITFLVRETDEPAGYNDIDGGLYLSLRSMRARLLAMAARRDMPFAERLALCVRMAADAQPLLRRGVHPMAALRPYDRAEFCGARWEQAQDAAASGGDAVWENALSCLDGMERLTEEWGNMLSAMRAPVRSGGCSDSEWENLLIYYIFRYFLEAVYDKNAYLQVKIIALSLCLIRRACQACSPFPDAEGRAQIACLYSREVENSQDNLDALRGMARRLSWHSLTRMILT